MIIYVALCGDTRDLLAVYTSRAVAAIEHPEDEILPVELQGPVDQSGVRFRDTRPTLIATWTGEGVRWGIESASRAPR